VTGRGGAIVQDCSYEIYIQAFRAVRTAVAARDRESLRAIRNAAMRHHGVANLASVLAVIEAERGSPERTKEDVCGGVLCTMKCPEAAGAVSAPRSRRAAGR